VKDWFATAVYKRQATSLGRFYLVAVKDLPVAQGKHIKTAKKIGIPDL